MLLKKIRIESIWIWSDLFKIHIVHLWLSRKHDDRCQKLNTSCCENVWLIKKSVVWTNGQWACERGPRLWYLSAHDTGDITHCSAIKRSTVSFKCNLRAYTISMTAYQFSSVQFIQESYKHVILRCTMAKLYHEWKINHKLVNFGNWFLCQFSPKRYKFLHGAFLTPQELVDFFFEKNWHASGGKSKKTCLFHS